MKTESDLLNRIELRHDFVKDKLGAHTITENGCWEYQGAIGSGGYGQFKIMAPGFTPYKRSVVAHRAAYAFFFGVDPGKLFVCHKCDNKKCINPDHLFLGTHQDNMDDMANKGRRASQIGESNPGSKINEDQVREVITEIRLGKTNKAIASHLDISHAMVSLIRLGKAWKQVANDMDYEPKPCFKRKSA